MRGERKRKGKEKEREEEGKAKGRPGRFNVPAILRVLSATTATRSK